MADHPRLPKHNPNANVTSVNQFLSLSTDVTEIVVDDGVSDSGITGFDLSGFSKLKRLEIGNDCFSYVEEVKLIGLSELESVEIGEKSFTKYKDTYHTTANPNRHFYLKDCPKLKSLKMGHHSFMDYTVCEIENVDALEMIEMGDLDEASCNFPYASLELKSILIHCE